jgi:intracellular proteinase inhibitor BsuPI
MKSFVLLLAMLLPGVLLAQGVPGANPSPTPATSDPSSAFSIPPPDEGSVFFAERQEAKFALSAEGRALMERDTVATYPRAKDSPDSVTTMFTRFFTDMFASIRLGRLRPEKTTETIKVEPSKFSLGERRELDATYTVRNNTKRIIRLDFNTTQRIDLLTFDPSGKIVEKWSEDRLFMLQEGVVIINPKERIEYSEKVATRDMKALEPYTIKADVIGYPDYAAETIVTPSP